MTYSGTVLVTGSSGFIGSALATSLCERGYRVHGLDLLSPPSNLCQFNNFSYNILDLSTSLPNTLPTPIDFVCHLAGQSSGEISFDSPVDDLRKNTVSTLNLIQYALLAKCRRFFYASSMSVYGNHTDRPIMETDSTHPLSCYGVSKLASEQYLSVYSSNLPSTSLRMFNVYGPGQNLKNLRQGMVSIYLAQASMFNHIGVKGSKNRFRDFIFIDDVVDVWVQCISNYLTCPSVLNVATGVKTSVDTLLQKIISIYPSTTIEYLNSTPGDQLGIYADVSSLSSFMNNKSFVKIDDGLKIFSDSIKL